MEAQHPHQDPLGLVGRVIGYDSDPNRKFVIEVFSHPDHFMTEFDEEDGGPKMDIGATYRYSVKMNYQKAGRKVITCKVTSKDLEDESVTKDMLRKVVLNYLEHNAEEMQVGQGDDKRIPWEEGNSCA